MTTLRILKVKPDMKMDIVSLFDRSTQQETSVLRHVDTGLIIGVHLPKYKPSPYTPEGGEEALKDILESGFVRGSHLFGFDCKHIGGYLYEPPVYQLHKVQALECCCCSNIEIGRQWHNRDTGYGICTSCVEYAKRGYTPEQFTNVYGLESYHYSIPRNLLP